MSWTKPKQLWSTAASQLGKARGIKEIVRASVGVPANQPEPTPAGALQAQATRHAKLMPSALKVAQRPDLRTPMDRLVDLYAVRLRAMIGEPNDKTRAAFYRTAQDILATGNSLPVDALAVQHGITRDLILRGLVQRGYMAAHRGPNPLQVRARRAVDWFRAKSSVSAAFTRRDKHANQLEDCRSVICPDAGPDDPCEECEEMAEKNQRQIMAHRAVVIKSNTGGIRARTDGNPVRYNSLGQRIR